MIPARSVRSAKFSAEHLKESQTLAGSRTVTAKIFSLILKVRSAPQVTFSVAAGKERQSFRTQSTSACIAEVYGKSRSFTRSSSCPEHDTAAGLKMMQAASRRRYLHSKWPDFRGCKWPGD